MSNLNAQQDLNQQYSILAIQGTAGTADTTGTAETIPVGADPDTGAMYVYNLGPAGSVSLGDISGGTIDNITSGTLDVNILSGSITAEQGDLTGGTINLLEAGTLTEVGTVTGLGTIANVGVVHNAGTIAALPDIPGGTIDQITAINGLPDIPGGTIDLITRVGNVGTVEVGTISNTVTVDLGANNDVLVTSGTVTVSNPTGTTVAIGAALPAGNNNIGNVDIVTLPDVPGGTIDAATISNGTANPLPNTIRDATNGAIGASVLDYTNSKPLAVRLTDTDGNYVTSSGGGTVVEVANGTLSSVTVVALSDLPGGTIDSATVSGNVGVTSLPDLPGGTIDTLSAITTLPDLPGGTIDLINRVGNVGTVEVGTISNTVAVDLGANNDVLVTSGSVALTAGTITGALPTGSNSIGKVAVTAGTISAALPAGSNNIGDVDVLTLPDLPGGTVDSITNLAAGTVQINPKPTQAILTYGTTITGTAEATLIAAPGASNYIFVNDISVVNGGTAVNTVQIGYGTATTQGATSLVRGSMAANGGGIEKPFPKAVNGNQANLALKAIIGATGTVDINVSYWTGT